ncbi:MAG: tautomerase family protein [Ruminococcus callidus]
MFVFRLHLAISYKICYNKSTRKSHGQYIRNRISRRNIPCPHITIKMLKGRTDDQKKLAADKVAAALVDAIGCNPEHISVAVEDFTPVEWQDEFRKEVTESEHIYKEPHYDPKDVL